MGGSLRIREDYSGYGRITQDMGGLLRKWEDFSGYERITQDCGGLLSIREDHSGYFKVRYLISYYYQTLVRTFIKHI